MRIVTENLDWFMDYFDYDQMVILGLELIVLLSQV